MFLAGWMLSACATVGPPPRADGVGATMRPYEVGGVWYRPRAQPDYDEVGLATWYGPESPNRRTADGEVFNVNELTAAHKTLPLPCRVEVTSLDTGRRIEVRVNDRGPFVAGRIIDLSPRAARELRIVGRGSARVRVRYVGPGSAAPSTAVAAADPPAVAQPPAAAAAIAPGATGYQIRAGAFADRANADRAAAVLSAQGAAHVDTLSRSGAPLYRVVVDCPDGTAPETMRRRVIEAGFAGATIVTRS